MSKVRDVQALVDQALADQQQLDVGAQVAKLPEPGKAIDYACPVCGEVYSTLEKAVACRDYPFDTCGLEIGDIMVVPGAYHNSYPLKDPWLAFAIPSDPESINPSDYTDYRIPYFVVTAIHTNDHNKHRCLVTLSTLCGGSLRVGWNPANGEGHYAMFRVRDGLKLDNNSGWSDAIETLLARCRPPEQMKKEATALADIGISTRILL